MARIVVVGAGVAGLAVALFAGRAGHDVVLVERDDTPLPDDPVDAFDWVRTGAPQIRHSHAFLARLRNLLRDGYPDVLERLHAAGATSMDFIAMLPEGMDRSPLSGDEDLIALACRRTTFEWVLRDVVLEEGLAALVHGRGVKAFTTSPGSDHEPEDPLATRPAPLVTGVQLDDGELVEGDIVVAATGRRGDLSSMVDPVRTSSLFPEKLEDTGIVYFSRFFKLLDGAELPPQTGPIGGDLGYLKYGIFPGDNRTLSVTLAAQTGDSEMRRALVDPDRFLRVARRIPTVASQVDEAISEPITGVSVMAGLINRRRSFVDDNDLPLVLGLHAIGDAHTCTNPIYGRGCSLAMVQASLFVDALEECGLDHEARAKAFEAATAEQIDPWYRASVAQDRLNARLNRDSSDATPATQTAASQVGLNPADSDPADAYPTGTDPAGSDPTGSDPAGSDTAGSPTGQEQFMRELLRDGLFPAMRVDPVVLRAFLRMFNLLEAPDSLMTNPDVIGRVMTVFQQRDKRPPTEPLGPGRSEMLAATI